MSVRSEKPTGLPPSPGDVIEQAQAADAPTAEGNSFNIAAPDNPLKRTVVVSIKASLNDMCLQKSRGTWAPSQEALRSIFQQKKLYGTLTTHTTRPLAYLTLPDVLWQHHARGRR